MRARARLGRGDVLVHGRPRRTPVAARSGPYRTRRGRRERCPKATGRGRTSPPFAIALATTAYMLYDDKNLYVAFQAERSRRTDRGDPVDERRRLRDRRFRGHRRRHQRDREPGLLLRDDAARRQYEQANENTRYPAAVERRGDDRSRPLERGLVIPLDVIRVPRGGKQTWRLQFVRGIAARGEHLSWVWDPIMQDAPSGQWPLFSPDRASGRRLRSILPHRRPRGQSRAPTFTRSAPSEPIAIWCSRPTARSYR